MNMIHPHEAHLWAVQFSHFKQEIDTLQAVLSADEHSRADRFCMKDSRARYITSRSILRHILSRYLNETPHTIQFAYNAHQKPFLKAHPTLHFNIAHSADFLLYGIARNPLGIDIEHMIKRDPMAIATRYFSAKECEILSTLPEAERHLAFYHIWSRKEAVVKALGVGLMTIPLENVVVSPNQEPETIVVDAAQLYVKSLEIHEDYAAAIATTQPVDKVVERSFSLTAHSL